MTKQERVEPNIYRRTGPQGSAYRVWMRVAGKVEDYTVDTIAEARTVRAKILDLRASKRAAKVSRPKREQLTFALWWGEWWPVRSVELTEGTRTTYESIVRNHVLPRFGDMPLRDIKVSHVVAARNEMDAVGSRATTDKAIVSVLGAALAAAAADELITSNPVPQMPRRRGLRGSTQRESKLLSVDEVIALSRAIDPWYSTMILFQAETGLRIGELAALRVMDLDLPAGKVRVEHSMPKKGRKPGPPKTDAGYRVVPLIRPVTAARLAAEIKERGLTPFDYVFGGRRGAPLDQDTFRERKFRPAVIKAGLGDRRFRGHGVSPHWLRHTAITTMVRMGLAPMEVAAIAGHRDSRISESIYTHLNTADLSHARVAIDRYWSQGTEPEERPA